MTPPASAPPAACSAGGVRPSTGPARPPEGAATSDASRPQAYVRRILVADDFPSFSRQMGELMASLQEGEASAQRLANLVLRDYALTVKVIRTANTVHYNRTGRPVQSATHAMMLLGAQTVRDLASSLLLFEQYRGRSPGLKELMLLSLLTAGHAREAAARLGLADPETAQLCGMFRNLGEVLVAAHLPAENAAILRAASERGGRDARRARDTAAAAVLGCSMEDIGVAIAGDWGMPNAVCRGMRATGERGEGELELISAFAHDLTVAIYREESGAARQGVAAVLERYGTRLKLTRDVLAAIADEAVAGTRETFAAAGVALDGLRLTRQLAAALSDRARATPPDAQGTQASPAPSAAPGAAGGEAERTAPPATAAEGAGPPAAGLPADAPANNAATPPPAAGAATAPAGPPVDGPLLAALRDRLARELEAAADDAATYDVQRVLLLSLEAALRGGPFDRACFCPIDVGTGAFRARFGLGEGVESLLGRFALPLAGAAATVGPALVRGEEIYLSSGTRLTLADAQQLRAWGAASAALVPVALEGTTIGAIYLDRRTTSAGLDATALVYVRRVVAAAGAALAARRAAAACGASARRPEPTAAEKGELVLRVLRGEPLDVVAAAAGVPAECLDGWRREFLEGAMARMGS